ncbi:MAG: hypothetical protein AAGH41_08575 [Pseudomonadota bacterium]
MFRLLIVVANLAVGSAYADDLPAAQKDLTEFRSLWVGTWSNDRHVFFAEDAGFTLENLAPQQEFRLVNGEKLQWVGDDGLVDVTTAVSGGQIKQVFRDSRGKETCRITWRRSGSQFAGQATRRSCAALIDWGTDEPRRALDFALSPTELWVTERGDGRTAQFRRARPFSCWVAVLRGAEHGDSGRGINDWDFRRDVRLHDQGGIAVITTDEDVPRTVRLQLRDVDWPYGNRRPSLTLYVLGEDDRAVSYSWTEGGADRIGINLRWLQASCTYDGD